MCVLHLLKSTIDFAVDEKGDLYNLVAVEEFDYQSLSFKYGEAFNYKVCSCFLFFVTLCFFRRLFYFQLKLFFHSPVFVISFINLILF